MTAPTFVAIPDLAENFGQFYVPRFEIKIAGVGLPRDVLRDVTQLTYHDDELQIDGFELSVNNWNEETNDFKYLGTTVAPPPRPGEPAPKAPPRPQDDPQQIFDPCSKDVTVSFGYGDDLQPIVTGNFTTVEPTFPTSGPATLAVRGLNVLHRLRRKQYTHAWPNLTDSQIAANLGTLTDPQTGQLRFPIPIVTKKHPPNEPQNDYVTQRNQYDIDFLLQRARERGYVVTTQPRDQGRKPGDELYFGPPTDGVPGHPRPQYELHWRKTLFEFKPTLTTTKLVRSVTVNGWNRTTHQPIRKTVTVDDPRINVNQDIRRMLASCDPRDEVVVDEPMFTDRQAEERALAILTKRHCTAIKATGSCLGIPGLRAGTLVSIQGIGSTFSGTYHLKSTTHTINDSGYTVRFEAYRQEITK
jgi:phage protein D